MAEILHLAVMLAAAAFGINYAVHDQERVDLNDEARRSVPGSFA